MYKMNIQWKRMLIFSWNFPLYVYFVLFKKKTENWRYVWTPPDHYVAIRRCSKPVTTDLYWNIYFLCEFTYIFQHLLLYYELRSKTIYCTLFSENIPAKTEKKDKKAFAFHSFSACALCAQATRKRGKFQKAARQWNLNKQINNLTKKKTLVV